MAYEVIILGHLHMPLYFLETFTEYPYEKAIKSKKVAGRRLIASSASNFNILYGSYYQSNLRFKTVEKP